MKPFVKKCLLSILFCTLVPVAANSKLAATVDFTCKTLDFFTTSTDEGFKKDYGFKNEFKIEKSEKEISVSIYSMSSKFKSVDIYPIEFDTEFGVFANIREVPDDWQGVEIRHTPEPGQTYYIAFLNYRLSNVFTSWLLACNEQELQEN